MKLAGLLSAALADPALAHAQKLIQVGSGDQVEITAPPALRPFLVGLLATAGQRGSAAPTAAPAASGAAAVPTAVLAVTATSREAEDLADALGCLIDRIRSRSTRPGRRCRTSGSRPARTPSAGGWPCCAGWPTRSRRRGGAAAGGRGAGPVGAAAAAARGSATWSRSSCAAGDDADLDEVVRRLADMAYARVDLVTKRGEFAVRGGILDVFPPTERAPVRVEFWGDEVEEIRTFAVADQRTLEQVERLWAPPCRELLLTDDGPRAGPRRWPSEHPELAEMLDKLAEGIPVEGMESLAPALLDGERLAGAAAALPAGRHHVLLCDPERIRTRAHDLVRTSEEFLAGQLGRGRRRRQGPDRPRRRRVPDPGRGAGRRRASSASRGGR